MFELQLIVIERISDLFIVEELCHARHLAGQT